MLCLPWAPAHRKLILSVSLPILKYPRTHHLQGSRSQPGDEDLSATPFEEIRGRFIVVEEKLDGANAGISFDGGELRLQSRGHYLTGGARERHFDLFKRWGHTHRAALHDALGERYIAYGEWLYAKHTVFYDQLPHYLMEFDIYDRQEQEFLSTKRRRELLGKSPLVPVPVLWQGHATSLEELVDRVDTSLYKSARWRERLQQVIADKGLDPERQRDQTDPSDHSEGLYIKVEEDGRVVDRLKYVRASFLTSVVDSGSHWLDRPIVPNQLAADVDIFHA